jgi:hypothetical protein
MVLVAIVVLDAARVWWKTLRPGGGIAPDAIPIPVVDIVPQPGGASAFARLREFASGFTGVVPLRGDVRAALARRSAQRKSCC